MAQDTHEQRSGIAARYVALIIALVMGGLAILVGVLFLTMQDEEDEETNPSGDVSDTASRLGEILEDPEQFQDKDITLVGEVGEIISDRSFTLVGAEGNSILIASNEPYTSEDDEAPVGPVITGLQVQVIGTVGILAEENRAALGSDFDYLLDDPAYKNFLGEPVMLTNLDGLDIQEGAWTGG